MFRKQESQVLWLREGDKISKLFFTSTKQGRARNQIIMLIYDVRNLIESEEGLVSIATKYFREIFDSSNPT